MDQTEWSLSDGFIDLADAVLTAFNRESHQSRRWGQRAIIPASVRRLIYQRDAGVCDHCGHGVAYADMHLDHVVPWSANGCDNSGNLRVMCARCNLSRRTVKDKIALESGRLSVTYVCVPCWFERSGQFDDGDGQERIAVFCGTCSGTSWDYPDSVC